METKKLRAFKGLAACKSCQPFFILAEFIEYYYATEKAVVGPKKSHILGLALGKIDVCSVILETRRVKEI